MSWLRRASRCKEAGGRGSRQLHARMVASVLVPSVHYLIEEGAWASEIAAATEGIEWVGMPVVFPAEAALDIQMSTGPFLGELFEGRSMRLWGGAAPLNHLHGQDATSVRREDCAWCPRDTRRLCCRQCEW